MVNSTLEIPRRTGIATHRTRRVAAGIGVGYVNMVLQTACAMISIPIYVRYLGKEEYGLWLVVLSILGSLSISGLGFPTVIQNMLAEAKAQGDWSRVSRVMVSGFWLLTLSALLAILFPAVAAKTGILQKLVRTSLKLQGTTTLVLLVSVLGYALAQPMQVFRLALRGFERVDLEQKFQSAFTLLSYGASVGAVLMGGGVLAMAVVYAFTQAVPAFCLLFYVQHKFPLVNFGLSRFSRKLAASMFIPGIHFLVVSLGGVLIWGVPNLVISAVKGVSFVPAFAVASSLLMSIRSVPGVVCATVAPTITALYAQSKQEALGRLVLLTTKLAVGAAFLFGVELICFGRDFIALWAGSQVVLDRMSFLVLVGVLIVNTVSAPLFYVLIATSTHRTYSYVVALEGVLNLGLAYWWVHKWGVLGVALSLLVSEVLVSGCYLPLAASRRIGLGLSKMWRDGIVPLLLPTVVAIASALPFVAHASTWRGWFLSTSVTMVVFLATYGIVSLRQEEREIARSIFVRMNRAIAPEQA
jgi:O-antigen/teichoic acid export membrane protein